MTNRRIATLALLLLITPSLNAPLVFAALGSDFYVPLNWK